MREIELTRGRKAKVDDDDFGWLSVFKWRYMTVGYAARRKPGPSDVSVAIYMHREIWEYCRRTKIPAGIEIDHVNRDGLDNRRDNLRLVTHEMNHWNREKQRGKYSSQFIGVSFCREKGKWEAYYWQMGKKVRVGSFNDETEAARSRDEAVLAARGDMAVLNFPEVVR